MILIWWMFNVYRWLWQHTIQHFRLLKDIEMVVLSNLYCFFSWKIFSFFPNIFRQMRVRVESILIPGRVQVALVWNSRNEKSSNSDKLNALANVSSSSWFLYPYILVLTFNVLFDVYLCLGVYSFCGEKVGQGVTTIWFTLYGLIFRHLLTMWVGTISFEIYDE